MMRYILIGLLILCMGCYINMVQKEEPVVNPCLHDALTAVAEHGTPDTAQDMYYEGITCTYMVWFNNEGGIVYVFCADWETNTCDEARETFSYEDKEGGI